MLALDECSGHQDLCGLSHRSVIPYVHGRMRVVLFKRCFFLSVASSGLAELGLRGPSLILSSALTFYSSRPDSYNETQDPTGDPGAGKTLCNRALIVRSSE
jgi:hypothetical protein